MRIPRIYIPGPLTENSEIALETRSAHYLATVLRMKAGMALTAFDGRGKEYPGKILDLEKRKGRVSLGNGFDPGTESRLFTRLGIGISRGERMDYVVQKSTELGVNVIQPLFTEYCEVRLDSGRAEKRRSHWEQVAISASEQSGRVSLPEVRTPVSLTEWLEGPDDSDYRFILDQDQTGTPEPALKPEKVTLLIGPEGGLAEQEKALAIDKGFHGLNLGPRTLRTETAPVAALSLFQYLWGR